MAIYKISDLLNKLGEIINDGYEYVDIFESTDDEDELSYLAFSAIEGDCDEVDYEEVESCDLPEDYSVEDSFSHTVDINKFCGDIIFTYKELFALSHAVDNALEHFKGCLEDPNNKESFSSIKQASVDCRNLQAKFAKFKKHHKIKQP